MSELEPNELVNAKEFIENGKFEKASQVLKDFGESEDISHYEQISYYILMGFLSDKLKDKEKLLDYAEKAYQACQGQEDSLQLVDVYIVKSMAYFSVYKYEEAITLLSQSEKILKSLNLETSKELIKREAEISCRRANIYFMIRDFDKALECAEQTLKLNKELDLKLGIVESLDVMKNIYYYLGEFEISLEYSNQCLLLAKEIDYKAQILNCYMHFGIIYAFRGEVDRAIEHYDKALGIAKGIDYKFGIAASLNNLGDLYRKQGRFNLARDTLEKSVIIFKELGISGVTSIDCLFHLALEEGDLELAQKYLEQLKKIQNRSKLSSMAYRVDKAIFLKTSPRSINRGKAEEMLKQVVKGEIIDYEITIIALLHLCDLLLNELKNSGDLEIIDEINPCIIKLLELGEKNHSYPLLAEVYIFQARLALVTLELKKARKLLTKAQNIADKYHLNNLAIKISTEHDELLKQLEMWENLKDSKAPLTERIELSHLSEQMEGMVKRRVFKLPKLEAEQPILLTIISKEGKVLLSNPFTADVAFDNAYFSEFLSSCNTLCDQIFSESFDRVKFGQHTVLIRAVDSFSICYMFQGQSYSARQKLIHFSKAVKKEPDIMRIIQEAGNKNIEIKVNEIKYLGELISESFLSDPQQFQMPFKAYKGDGPFVFVSYSHTDRLQVYPIIDYLNRTGINIWYDEGILVGEDWKSSIVNNLERCSAFLVFISPHIINSEYVQKEISFALKKKKPFFGVNLKETKLPSKIEFELGDIQIMEKYLIPEPEFYIKLRRILDTVLNK
ncbi:MAG: tetratricopeptide repeat protein [Candidatus Hodarchaeota archaeon]